MNRSDLAERLRTVLTDTESNAVLKLVRTKLGGCRIHKSSAAALLLLEQANLHQAAETLVDSLSCDREILRMLEMEPEQRKR